MSRSIPKSIPEKFYNMKIDCSIKFFGINIKNEHMHERVKLEQSEIDQMIEVNLDPENINDLKTGFDILLSRRVRELNKKLTDDGYPLVGIHCTGDIYE